MSISKFAFPVVGQNLAKMEIVGFIENVYWILISFEKFMDSAELAALKQLLIELRGQAFSFGPDNGMNREALERMACVIMPMFVELIEKERPLFATRIKEIDWKKAFGVPVPDVEIQIN